MKNLELTAITHADAGVFDKTEYAGLSFDQRAELIESSTACSHGGKFFKFYLLKDGGVTVGVLNVCAVSKSVVSVAPEIFAEFRGKGYAFCGLQAAYERCKELGFKVAAAGIRAENTASVKLHEKLGFELVKSYKSKSGRDMVYYVRTL